MLPDLIRRFSKIPDYRRTKRVKHKITVLMVFGLFAFIFQLSSRREMNRELTRPVVFEQLKKLFPELETIPHADTLARALEKIDPASIEAIHMSLIRELIKKKKFKKLLIQDYQSKNPQFSPPALGQAVQALLDGGSEFVDFTGADFTAVSETAIFTLATYAYEYMKHKIKDKKFADIDRFFQGVSKSTGLDQTLLYKKMCKKVDAETWPTFDPIVINGHTYCAIGPRTAIEKKNVPGMKEFVVKVSQYPVLINLMGGWQLSQQGYVRPSSSDTKRDTAIQGCRQVLADLASIVDTSFTAPESAIADPALSELIQKYTEAIANKNAEKIRTIAQRAVTQLGEDSVLLGPRVSTQHVAHSFLRSVNQRLRTILSEEEGFEAFEAIYKESGRLGTSIRVFDKKEPQKGSGTDKNILKDHAYEVPWDEATGVFKNNPTEEDQKVREASPLIEHMKDAQLLVKKIYEGDTAFVHCAKGNSRTGKFLLLLELFRNEALVSKSDDEIRAFICATMIQLGLTEPFRMSDAEVVFDQRFIQAFRDVVAGKDPSRFVALSTSTSSPVAAAGGGALVTLMSDLQIVQANNIPAAAP